ncbi:MAG: PASTA domain-containing protein [Pseudonocardia sp.]|nr:PASTA domain-containing protein [Pseudonocardia sp.]
MATRVRALVVPAALILCLAACSGTSWAMPDLVGRDLQSAQDTIQQLSGFGIAITTTHDLSGRARQQVFDQDWQVCTQNIAAGSEITPDSLIDFGVLPRAESC